ncbi:transposase IS116/IS110/IS902 family protein [Schinkia azotoformans LMG 9581]|uniref:Transposase IS116/IS110/IS902 family protein n=1 Tax=Schinkia azotoformans LMG 9581 TaxID=1131731 RepID=K6CQT5_SCHAZ|nr:transposase IS116/IS110/IS902 family protein [Schinkia azotoformans LMG 9581]
MLDQEVAKRVSEYQEDVERIDSIPGIATQMAEQILSEVGRTISKCTSHVFMDRSGSR